MFLLRALCIFNKHSLKRSSAHWDGIAYVGTCRHCGKKMRRVSRGNWRSDWIKNEEGQA